MQVHLGGHLSWYDAEKRTRLEVKLPEPISLISLLGQLGIPAAEIAVVAVNGAPVPLENAQLSDEDKLDLLPPIGGG